MNSNNSDKLEKILEELNKVLDEFTKGKKTVVDNQEIQNIEKQCEQKIKEIKENLKSVVQEEEKSVQEIQQVFKETPEYTTDVIEKQEEKTVKIEEKVVPKIEPVSPPVITKNSTQQVQTEQGANPIPQTPPMHSTLPDSSGVDKTIQQTKVAEGGILINTVFIYPSTASDSKDLFFENINSTFTRMTKTQIKLIPSLYIEYNSIEKDLLSQIEMLLEKIKTLSINALFCVVTEALSTEQKIEEFMNKVSLNVSFAKTVNFSELKMKSFYLDLAIDLLLTIPQCGKM